MLRQEMRMIAGSRRFHSQFAAFMAVMLAAAALTVDLPKAQAAPDDKVARKGNESEEFEPEETGKGPPPSKMLERAKKLYDRGDYYSASIEFDKVIKGNEDSEGNKQRAEFFMGKTLFHLKFYAASMVYFDAIVQKGPPHKYYRRTLQWLAAIAEVLPESA